jgi:peptidoglycan hydrolase-like protein with peptidoglycan-binding domain
VTFADEQIVYRDLGPDGDWGTLRLLVDGRDVTGWAWEGGQPTPAQIGGYQLTEPYGYGPADFSFPHITSLHVDQFGSGELAWFDLDKRAELVQVDAAGIRVRTVWRGFITVLSPTNDGTNVHCDGDASGRLALRDKHPELFTWIKDVGVLLADAFGKCNLSMTPRLGIETGIELDERRLSSSGKMLGYCDEILAQSMKANGDQLTVMPDGNGNYVQQWKDRTTVAASIFNGAAGVEIDLSRDLSEEPTTLYASGRRADGGLWLNAKAPGLKQGEPAPFPGTLSLGDSGDDVQTLQSKLVGMGYLDREDAAGDDFDADTEEAVQALQEDAGLAETGVVNSATWDALFDLGDTGLSLRQAHVAPLVELSETRKYNRTSNGSKAGPNPNYNPARTPVDRTYEGFGEKKRAKRYLKRELARIHNGKNWQGTVTLKADVIKGDHAHADNAPEGYLSRLDLTPGQNVKLHNFDSVTLFHVSGINVDSDLTVRLAVDTKARDLMTLGAILERNAASRVNPARQWLRQHQGRGPNQQIVEFLSEIGGKVWTTVDCPANTWTVFPVVAGQSGSISRVRVQVTSSSETAFALGITAIETSGEWWSQKLPDPLAAGAWDDNWRIQKEIDAARALLGFWGDDESPAGYSPHVKADGWGKTGLLLDDGGFDYHTFDQPVAWFAIHPDDDCKIEPQRVLWSVLEAGM